MCKGRGHFSWIRQTDLHKARIGKRLRIPGIDSKRLGTTPGLLKRFKNTGSGYGTNTASQGQRFFAVLYRTAHFLSSICLTVFSVGHPAEG